MSNCEGTSGGTQLLTATCCLPHKNVATAAVAMKFLRPGLIFCHEQTQTKHARAHIHKGDAVLTFVVIISEFTELFEV